MKLSVVFALFFVVGCSASNAPNRHYQILETHSLDAMLKETSGLYCPTSDLAYTINDSGNQAVVYQINGQGSITHQQKVAVSNIDWEAITGDTTHIFIGDIGNNSGKRNSGIIHSILRADMTQPSSQIEFSYAENNIAINQNRQHDFDAEALIAVDDKLYLFSKSWKSQTLIVYQIDTKAQRIKGQGNLTLEAFKKIDGISGVITGGDYDTKNQRFVLVGYQLQGLARLNAFVVILGKHFERQKMFFLPELDQAEGLCVTPKGEIWITQEGSFFSSQKLVKLRVY